MNILFAGEDAAPGSGRYLLAVLKAMRASVTHVPALQRLSARALQRSSYAGILLSDFPRAHASMAAQRAIVAQVHEGAGLLMIGGWGSFSGPFGCWKGSLIEQLLPVTCHGRDDRKNFPSGALIVLRRPHGMWRGLSFVTPPVICGLNLLRPKPSSQVLLGARPMIPRLHTGGTLRVSLSPQEYPLLVVGASSDQRVAALATDAAPHWCGGLVDWGTRSLRLPVTKRIDAEVGDRYVQLFSCLIRWLTRSET